MWRGLIDKVYVIGRTALHDPIYNRIQAPNSRLPVYTDSLIKKILAREEKKYGNKRRVLLYFDDIGGQGVEITTRPKDPFVSLTTMSRHIGSSALVKGNMIVVLAAQCMSLVPTIFRKNNDAVVMFYEDNPSELKETYKNYGFCNYDNFVDFIADNLTEKHDFIYVRRDTGFSTWWKNLAQSLDKTVQAIKSRERMARKRKSSAVDILQLKSTPQYG